MCLRIEQDEKNNIENVVKYVGIFINFCALFAKLAITQVMEVVFIADTSSACQNLSYESLVTINIYQEICVRMLNIL